MWKEIARNLNRGVRTAQREPALAEARALLAIVDGLYDYAWTPAAAALNAIVAHEPLSPALRCLYV